MSKIQDIRKARGLSQDGLASLLKEHGVCIQRTTISNYEAGRIIPSVNVLQALAHIFEMSMEEVLRSIPESKEPAHA